MTITVSALIKSAAVSVLGVSIPLTFPQSNLSSAFAGFIGGASAATVFSQSTSSRKKEEEDTLSVEQTVLAIEDKAIAIPSIQKEEHTAISEAKNNIAALLKQKGIEIIEHRTDKAEDELFDSIAIYLSKRYSLLEKLQKVIKASIVKKTDFTFNLYGKSQQEIQSCTQYCNKLYRATLLSHYYYDKRKKIIRGNVQRRGDIIQFLNGGWFERAILNQVKEKFAEAETEFLVNPHLEFANGDRFELDILFLAEGELFWIECKTGNHYNDCLPKYCQHGEKLGVAKENAFLVGLGLSDCDAERWTKLWTITVVNPEGLSVKISRA